MAIFSLNHKSIGKSTQARPYTAGAHVNYITRPNSMTRLDGARMPVSKAGAQDYFHAAEDGDRANGRVADKVLLALPKELSAEQRVELVRSFAEEVTQSRAPWLAAFHDKGKDAHNPHCHLVIRDRDPETNRRVIGLSEKGSTQRLREAWSRHANQALEQAGSSERIDHQTLAAQGKDVPATVHEGPRAQAMDRRRVRPRSQVRRVRNGCGARRRERQVNYPDIDHGRTRPEFNRYLRQSESAADLWAAVDADNIRKELQSLGQGQALAQFERQNGSLMDAIKTRPGVGLPAQPSFGPGGKVPHLRLIPGRDRFVDQHIAGVQVPAELFPASRNIGQSTLPPTADRVVGVKATDERADILKKPDIVEIEAKRGQTGSKCIHEESMSNNPSDVKEMNMSEDDLVDSMNKRKRDIDQHKADQNKARYDDLMKRSFLDPAAAEAKMNAFRVKNGDEALYQALDDNATKTQFGRRPGSILSPEGYQKGAQDRRDDSIIARRQLGEAARNHHRDSEIARGSRRAAEKPEHQPARSEAKPSFSQRLEDRRQTAAQEPGAGKEQRDRDLARLRASREEDKERGR